MTTHRTGTTVSRRTALAGLGAGGLGLALAPTVRSAVAQDATPSAMATHSIIGAWYFDFDPANPGTLFVYTSFHADGTRSDVHPFAGAGIGAWTATGERTGESINKYQNIATAPRDVVPGTVTVCGSFTVDEDGNSFTGEGVVELRGIDGTIVALFPFAGEPSYRLTVEPPPRLQTPEAEATSTS